MAEAGQSLNGISSSLILMVSATTDNRAEALRPTRRRGTGCRFRWLSHAGRTLP